MTAEFKGIPLIKRLDEPNYNFLIGDFGKEMNDEYNSVVKSDYKDNSNLKVLNFKDNIVKGSNSYSIFLMNKMLSKYELRTVNSSDAQKIINSDENFLKGVYTDLGVVLRTEDNPNGYLARQLGKQANERRYKFSNSNPLVFKPSDLELIVDNNSPSGLGFKIQDSASPFNASELSNRNSGKNFKKMNDNGFPVFDRKGNRTNYTENDGLCRFYLGRYSGLYSWNDNLVYSDDIGRVVCLNDAEIVSKK